MTPVAVVTTVGSADEARRMARALVEGRLAACVQMAPIDSVYVWDGAVQESAEVRLIAKTTAERYDAVETAIRALHSYDLPAIHSVALDRVHAAYGEWIAAWVSSDDGAAAGDGAAPSSAGVTAATPAGREPFAAALERSADTVSDRGAADGLEPDGDRSAR
jgi:periplasmic divalent cation tolerance protein